jgi:transposase
VQDFRLTSQQRRRLRAALKSTRDVGVVKRIVALLELDEGTSPADVAAHLGVTRQTLHNWTHRFDAGGGLRALHDRARCGRPPKLSAPVRRLLVWLLKQPPNAFDYRATGWTASLLRKHLATRMGVHVSARTMRRALHQMKHAWKRPRYVLQPDPDREKKTPDSPTNRTAA